MLVLRLKTLDPKLLVHCKLNLFIEANKIASANLGERRRRRFDMSWSLAIPTVCYCNGTAMDFNWNAQFENSLEEHRETILD